MRGSGVRVWKVEGARVRYTSSSLTLLDMTAKKVHGYSLSRSLHWLVPCPVQVSCMPQSLGGQRSLA